MKRILVVYGTREGHTAKIAEYVGTVARDSGYEVQVRLCKELATDFDLGSYDGIILAAPVHDRKHESSVVDFVRRYRVALESVHSAFLSTGLVPILPHFIRRKAAAGVVATLFKETGWKPNRVLMVGGAIMYRQYSQRQQIIFRLMMLLLGGPTDLSRDHDLTDWASVHQFVKEFLASFSRPTGFR